MPYITYTYDCYTYVYIYIYKSHIQWLPMCILYVDRLENSIHVAPGTGQKKTRDCWMCAQEWSTIQISQQLQVLMYVLILTSQIRAGCVMKK